MKLHENIKNFRTFRGIKQQQLADALNRSKSVISNWERGENSPDVESCEKMCKIFKVTPNELFGWEKNDEYMQWIEKKWIIEHELSDLKSQRDEIQKRIDAYTQKVAKYKDIGKEE